MKTTVSSTDYFRYWGKARPTPDSPITWHPLAYHNLDVAAVGVTLLEVDPRLKAKLATVSGLDEAATTRWVFLALALHDLGKFAPTFQAKNPDLFAALFGDGGWRGPDTSHDHDGLLMWKERYRKRDDMLSAFGSVVDGDHGEWRDAATAWLGAAICHHGRPRSTEGSLIGQHFQEQHFGTADAFVADVLGLARDIGHAISRFPRDQGTASWLVAGLAILADWIGSNQQWFPYCVPDTDLANYWRKQARPRAERALREAGVVPAKSAASVSLAGFMPENATPSPLQQAVAEVALGEGPRLFVIEDQTGSGKTEAALTLAGRLIAAGRAGGLFIALPTQATANAMYRRCARLYRRLFAAAERPSIVLAHAQRDLVLHDIALRGRSGETPYDAETDTASATCARWLGDDQRKAALADCGVGTVDQAVLAVMPSRHQSLRLAGLSHKVLVIDEVHAHEAYLRRLICGLLRFHAALGGSAILLSATLPAAQRRDFAVAFAEGLGIGVPDAARPDEAYPLLTKLGCEGLTNISVAPRPGLGRNLDVRLLSDFQSATKTVAEAAQAGRAVCWIRNTVADAMEAFEDLRGRVPTTLFHARFAMGDRLDRENEVLDRFGPPGRATGQRSGHVLVATQVAEQSLDLDFDAMVSDLAPIDSLIQRAGRLWRHSRPDRNGSPILYVLAPEPTENADSAWYSRMFRGAAKVYPDHAGLWLTARELVRRGTLRLPEDARALIEAVYGEAGAFPEALEKSRREAEGKDYSGRAIADTTLLPLIWGYLKAVGKWEDDIYVSTRLGEKQARLRLARWTENQLRPWRDGGDWRAWRLSEVSILWRWAAQAAPLENPALARAIDAAKAEWPEKRDDSVLVPLIPPIDGTGAWVGRVLDADGQPATLRYDNQTGLAVVRGG